MKIIDAFTFYNELDLLLYRLTALDHVVDYFIIVEATKTHTGKDKELFFENNKHLYEKFLPKIIHIIDEDLLVPDISAGQQWYNEIHQRDDIYRGLQIL
jgi:beta-1,4-mannosyl-glycoprotein beta-1,4-N-acetylglucosaminyltransferase